MPKIIETPGGQNPQCSSSILLPFFSINSMARGFCDIPRWYGECSVCQGKESLVSHNVWRTYSGRNPNFLETLRKETCGWFKGSQRHDYPVMDKIIPMSFYGVLRPTEAGKFERNVGHLRIEALRWDHFSGGVVEMLAFRSAISGTWRDWCHLYRIMVIVTVADFFGVNCLKHRARGLLHFDMACSSNLQLRVNCIHSLPGDIENAGDTWDRNTCDCTREDSSLCST